MVLVQGRQAKVRRREFGRMVLYGFCMCMVDVRGDGTTGVLCCRLRLLMAWQAMEILLVSCLVRPRWKF